jgi:tetratricopeptide (TPR) repeat protein
MAKKSGKVPNENWYLLLRVNYYELGDYKNMVEVLEELLQHYPKDEYWLTLAGIYGELEKTKQQLSILEMLYEHGNLKKESQLLNLANLYLLHNAPYKTASFLDKEIKNKTIKANKKNLRLLSQAWYQAKENEESIPPLKQAAALSNDGELDIRLAQSYLNLEKWEDAVAALKSGLAKGGIKRQDTANIMFGHALFELHKYEASINAFKKARADKRSRKTADKWIVFIQSEQDRQKQLQEGLM